MEISSRQRVVVVDCFTSRTKSPETPQEVVAPGASLVEVDEAGITVCVGGAALDTDGSSAVVVTVVIEGARRVLSRVVGSRVPNTYMERVEIVGCSWRRWHSLPSYCRPSYWARRPEFRAWLQ